MPSAAAQTIKLLLKAQQPVLMRTEEPLILRRVTALVARLSPLPKRVVCERQRIGDVRVQVIHNLRRSARSGHVLVYLHGGGYSAGSSTTHRGFVARLMQAGGFAQAWLPDYRLAPEHPFPAGLEDVVAVWNILTARTPADQVCLAGESAGGGLSLALMTHARHEGLALPVRCYLHSPWLDLSLSSDTYGNTRHRDACFGNRPERKLWLHRTWAQHYLGDYSSLHPLISPVFSDLTGLPPLFVQTAGEEMFRGDSETLAERCQAQATPCEVEIWPGMWHAFAAFAPFVPEANLALSRAGHWLKHGHHES